jgi:uncharacterized membrane protein YhdT
MKALMVLALIMIATSAGMWMSRYEDGRQSGRWAIGRSLAYWLVTVLVTFELTAGAVWDFLHIEYVRVMLAHLGYPLYLAIILGAYRIPGALALVAPGVPRLKEWAYAGCFFNYTGAAASHMLAGDRAEQLIAPLVLAALTLISWRLRPQSRVLSNPTPVTATKPALWLVSVSMVVAMLAIGYFTLPAGGPTQ